MWALLAIARWRYADTSRLKELEKRPGGAIVMDLLLWRLTAHLGPYQARGQYPRCMSERCPTSAGPRCTRSP